MELKSISSEEFTAMYNASYEPKQKVDKVDVRSIVSEFVYSGAFIMEVVLNEQDRPNSRSLQASGILLMPTSSPSEFMRGRDGYFCAMTLCRPVLWLDIREAL